MCSYPLLTETSLFAGVTTGEHLVLSITNRQNNYGLEECCQIPLEELQKSSMARYSISDDSSSYNAKFGSAGIHTRV